MQQVSPWDVAFILQRLSRKQDTIRWKEQCELSAFTDFISIEKSTCGVLKISNGKMGGWWRGRYDPIRIDSLHWDFTLNYFLDGITLITKDEAPGSSVTAEEAKKVLQNNTIFRWSIVMNIIFLMPIPP